MGIDKNGEETTKSISYTLQSIDNARFMMASSLSNLVNNLSEEIHRIKCKYCKYFLNKQTFKMI